MSYSVSQDPTLWPCFCSSLTGSFLFPWNTRLLLPQELCLGRSLSNALLSVAACLPPSAPSTSCSCSYFSGRPCWPRGLELQPSPSCLLHFGILYLFSPPLFFFLLYLIFLTFLVIASFMTSSLWILPLENKFCEEKEFYSIHYGISRT